MNHCKKSSQVSRQVNGRVANISLKPAYSNWKCQPKLYYDFVLLTLGRRSYPVRQGGNPVHILFVVSSYWSTELPIIQPNLSDLKKGSGLLTVKEI